MSGSIIAISILALLDLLPIIDLRRPILMLFAVVCLAALPACGDAQTLAAPGTATPSDTRTTTAQPNLIYVQPTQTAKLHNYIFDAFGPYPITISAVAGGINQMENSPPDWNQGASGYGKRFGSNLGIEAVSTTTRYALSEALRQDPLYYRCACKGAIPRFTHAVISTFTARAGQDGHRVFSFPALIGPYAGSMTAVYAWYPSRYGAKDALRIGSYSLLEYMGGNIALEFLYTAPRSLISRMHLNNRHGAPDPGLSQ
jgi:hypothetical protein